MKECLGVIAVRVRATVPTAVRFTATLHTADSTVIAVAPEKMFNGQDTVYLATERLATERLATERLATIRPATATLHPPTFGLT